jgi:ABC-2 type transport system ATP-binding protein
MEGAVASHGPVLRVSSLTKRFGDKLAVDDVSLGACAGEIIGILGPNGAGKSTLIGMLCGLLVPDAGSVEIFGRSFAKHRASILARMNIASPYASFPGQLTARQNLSIYADLYGVHRAPQRIAELLELFGISGQAADVRLSKLSSGQVIRVSLCKALLNRPELLLLDEPTAYLDNEIAAQTRNVILQEREARGTTILLTSHNLAEVQGLCDRIVLLSRGRVVACGTPLEVTRSVLGVEREGAALAEVFSRAARGEI